MATERKGFFKRTFDPQEPQVRSSSVSVPNLTTSPPSWREVSSAFISLEDALSIPAVYRSVTLLSTTVSQLEMTVERNGNPVSSSLAARPDNNRSQAAFIKRTMYNLATTGNAYWRLFRNAEGAVVQMEVLPNSRVLIKHDKAGKKFYEYDGQTLTNNTPTSNGQVEHIRLGEFEGYVEGRGPIQVCNRALASIFRQREYYNNFLDESKRPSGIYSFADDLDAEEMAHAKATIMANRDTGQPDVLGKGVTYQTVMFTAEETGLIEMNKAGIAEVARIFGLPPHMLNASNEGSSMDYNNLQMADVAFLRYAAEEYLTAIEDAFTNVLPRGQVASFDTENWLRSAVVATAPVQQENQQKETASAA